MLGGGRLVPARAASTTALCALLALVLTGCASVGANGASSSPSATAHATGATDSVALTGRTGPATAHLADADIEPITSDPKPVLPATVTDNQGNSVTVKSVDRILALDVYGSLAATVYGLGLGAHLVGRDSSTGFPAAAKLPLVTVNGHQLSAEAILALHPSVLITDTSLGPWDVVLQMRSAGVPVVVVNSQRSLSTVDPLVDSVAAALGVRAEGRRLTARLSSEISAARAHIDRLAPSEPSQRLRIVFLYVRGNAGVYYIFGQGSGVDSLISALDGVDVATEAGIKGYSPLNAEALAKTRPDVIMMMTAGLQSVGGVSGALKLPGVAQTPAGQHRRIVDMSDYQVLSFGPLTASVLEALAAVLYAPTASN
jgi:iron complex transport system substrate-binding protein